MCFMLLYVCMGSVHLHVCGAVLLCALCCCMCVWVVCICMCVVQSREGWISYVLYAVVCVYG